MTDDRPNILLIILDTLRRDRLSIYGHERETSPEFDAFAARSTLFERAIAPAQWTIPAHGSIFSGEYASTHQLTQANERLSDEFPALAEILKDDGYHTVGFCNNPLVGVLNNGLKRGFDHFYNYAGTAANRPQDVRKSIVRRTLRRHWIQFARRVENQFAHSDAMFRISMHPRLVPVWTRFTNFKGHTQLSIDDLIDYWGAHHTANAQQPIFAFVNLMGAHLPYKPLQQYLDNIAPELRNDRAAYRFMRDFNADAARWASPLDKPLEDWQKRTLDGFYDAEIRAQDEHLGRLLKYLRTSGKLENTLVIIAADHGEGHGDHDFCGHGFVVYQELIHVPLAIHYPGHFPEGRRVKTNVSTRRIFHTVLDAAGVKSPAYDPESRLALQHAVNGRPDAEGNVAFTEAFPPKTFLNVIDHRTPWLIESLRLQMVRRGVYDGAHKLAVVGDDVEGLYEVDNDPTEAHDVAMQNPELVTAMQAKITGFARAAQQPPNGAGNVDEVSDEVVEHLRSLGYLE